MGLHSKLELNEFFLKKKELESQITNEKFVVQDCEKCGFPFITVKVKEMKLCKKCGKL